MAKPAHLLSAGRIGSLELRNRIIQLTAPASLGGQPVLSLPVPLPGGLTTGLQVIVPDHRSPVLRWALRAFRPDQAS